MSDYVKEIKKSTNYHKGVTQIGLPYKARRLLIDL